MRNLRFISWGIWILQIGLIGLFISNSNLQTNYCLLILSAIGIFSLILVLVYNYSLSTIRKREEILRTYEDGLEKVSHDLRAPLLSMSLISETQMEEATDEQKESWKLVLYNSRWMRILVERNLDLRSLRQKSMVLHRESLDFHSLLKEVTDLLSSISTDFKQRYHSHLTGAVMVEADSVRLRQVFFNLLGNAVKFAVTGPITVETKVVNNVLRTRIIDDGPGLPRDFSERFLKPLHLKHLPSWVNGTGIGLRLTAEILRSHGSKLSVIPSERGTIWEFELLLSPPQNNSINNAYQIRPKIYLVEDDALYAKLFIAQVQVFADVSVFSRPGPMLEKLEEGERPNAILADYHLPDMNGQDLIHKARLYKDLEKIPMVLISSSTASVLWNLPRANTVDQVWMKHLSPREIREKIFILLDNKY